MKISNLMNRDFKLVEKKKIWFIVPACIIAVAIVMMIIFGCVTGEPLNLGMDFQGGYTVNVKLSTKLTSSTAASYKSEIKEIIEGLTDENGNNYNIKVSSMQEQGSGESASVYVRYKAPHGISDEVMEDEINPAIQSALQEKIFKIVPTLAWTDDKTCTVDYQNFSLVESTFDDIKSKIQALAAKTGATISSVEKVTSDNQDAGVKALTVKLSANSDAFKNALSDTVSINDKYSGQAVKGDIISATVSSELLINALLAISLAIVLMLVYIAFRFEVSSGVSAIVALLHDILIMFSFMAIFRVEINSTFIAALITILGYSINNTIIVFDRIRENTKSVFHKNSTATLIANASIKDTLVRSINTSLTTLITIAMVAIMGAAFQTFSLSVFALPIIVGLLAGTFSSIFISPSIWAMWKDRKKKLPKADKKEKKLKENTTALA